MKTIGINDLKELNIDNLDAVAGGRYSDDQITDATISWAEACKKMMRLIDEGKLEEKRRFNKAFDEAMQAYIARYNSPEGIDTYFSEMYDLDTL